jgi:hypothetical protein
VIDIECEKSWWDVAQGVTAGLITWYTTGDSIALRMADESMNFFMDHFYDSIDGEVYAFTDAEGIQCQVANVPDYHKGYEYKAGFHSLETSYYAYLYMNLYYYKRPAVLYYKYDPVGYDRSVRLYPIAIEDEKLRITSVEKDGVDYTGFDSEKRLLHIAAHEGGKFKVTFENDPATSIASRSPARSYNIENHILRTGYRTASNSSMFQIVLSPRHSVHTVSVFMANGRSVWKQRVDRSTQLITVPVLSPGCYFVSVQSPEQTSVFQCIHGNK